MQSLENSLAYSTATSVALPRKTYVSARHVALRMMELYRRCHGRAFDPEAVVVDTSPCQGGSVAHVDEMLMLGKIVNAAFSRFCATECSVWGRHRIHGESLGQMDVPKSTAHRMVSRIDERIDYELDRRGLFRRTSGDGHG